MQSEFTLHSFIAFSLALGFTFTLLPSILGCTAPLLKESFLLSHAYGKAAKPDFHFNWINNVPGLLKVTRRVKPVTRRVDRVTRRVTIGEKGCRNLHRIGDSTDVFPLWSHRGTAIVEQPSWNMGKGEV